MTPATTVLLSALLLLSGASCGGGDSTAGDGDGHAEAEGGADADAPPDEAEAGDADDDAGDADAPPDDAGAGDADDEASGEAEAPGDGPVDELEAGDADDGGPACSEGDVRCGTEGVETCTAGAYVVTEYCPEGCTDGACDDVGVSCTPGAVRCYRNSVERCNATGTAWLFDSICPAGCVDGLCEGACEPGEARCNGDTREVCGPDGETWVADEVCALGCEHRVCVEEELDDPGLIVELSGLHAYRGCVTVDLGGSISVPAGESLEIWARCLVVSASAGITLGAGSSLRFHARETAEIDGEISGGQSVTIEAYESLRNGGSVSSASTILRADRLANEAGGSVGGTTLAALLYGSALTDEGTHEGVVSVMPPDPLVSPTHPAGGVWNLTGDAVVVAWDRPFAGAMGYYVAVGHDVPGPATGEFRTAEYNILPSTLFGPGENRVRVTTVNADSEVGTYAADLAFTFNVSPPLVSSESHPVEGAWGGSDDVFLSWTDPPGLPAAARAGYFRAWDRQADTVPAAGTGTFDDRDSLLLPDQPAGVWYFHIVNIDRLGRTSPLTAHYQVRIGPDPGSGNVAGTITDAADDEPIAGATVLLNGGLLRAVSGTTGDYTFLGAVPASAEPYRLTASARGYLPAADTILIGAGSAEVRDYSLVGDPAGPSDTYRLGWEFRVSPTASSNPSVALGPSGRLIWARVGSTSGEDSVAIVRSTGEALTTEATLEEYYSWGARTEVGWSGDRFYAIDYYKCRDDGSLSYGHGWSCLRMRTWNESGGAIDGWVAWANSGHSGSPSAAWNGSTFGTFFVSYAAVYFRELTEDLEFANGGGPTMNSLVAGGYGDTRQSARTRALWDGSGYAVAWIIEEASSGALTLYFGRWARDLGVLLSPVRVDPAPSSIIGLAWDGRTYHLAYVQQRGADRDVVLRTVSADGTLGARTVVVPDAPSTATEASLAWDGRHLLLAYAAGADGSDGALEARSPADHAPVESIDLGRASRPRVAVNAGTGEGVVIYVRPDAPGTFIRPLFIE